eukprot:jgi/Ulvmu1/639/UM010_0009.1
MVVRFVAWHTIAERAVGCRLSCICGCEWRIDGICRLMVALSTGALTATPLPCASCITAQAVMNATAILLLARPRSGPRCSNASHHRSPRQGWRELRKVFQRSGCYPQGRLAGVAVGLASCCVLCAVPC